MCKLFTEQPGPKVSPSCEAPEDCFTLFFFFHLLQYMVDQTNAYTQKKLAAMQVEIFIIICVQCNVHVQTYLTECCRYHLGPFTGIGSPSPRTRRGFWLILYMELKFLKDYWSTHYTTNMFFRSIFSRDRFSRSLGPCTLAIQTAPPRKGRSSHSLIASVQQLK